MKEIYLWIKNKLNQEVKALRWIDMDTDQLGSATRPAIALPAALINVDLENCKSLADKIQICDVKIDVTLVFDTPGATSSNTPEEIVNANLSPYDVIQTVHEKLQGFETNLFEPLSRISGKKRKNRHGLFQYEISYRTILED